MRATVPFLKDAAKRILVVFGMLKLIRSNRRSFKELCRHLGAAVATMEGFGEMLDRIGTPINAEFKTKIRDRMDGALNELHAFVENKLRLRISDHLTKKQKHGTDIEQIRDTKERFLETMRLFSMSVDLSDAEGLHQILELEKYIHEEQLLRQEDDLAAEVEKLHTQMAIVQLERADRAERKRLADEEERSRKKREAEMQRAALMTRLDEMKEKVLGPELGEDVEADQRATIVNGIERMEIEGHRQPQLLGVTGCRASPRLETEITASSSLSSKPNGSENARSPPGPQYRPLPPLPFRRPTLDPDDHDGAEGYEEQGRRDEYRLSRRCASRRYVSRYDECENDGLCADKEQRMVPRRPMDEDRYHWTESGYDLSLPADSPSRQLEYRSQYESSRPDYGPPAAVSPSEILRGLRLQQSELVPAQAGGGGTTNVSVGSGDIMGSSLSNVGNITSTTYVFIGAPF